MPLPAPGPTAPQAAAHTAPSLVLFLGFGPTPERELLDSLAQVDVRGLWLGPTPAALGSSAHARFDAVVLKVEGPMARAARAFDGWRRSLRCPLLVVSDGGDEVDEIIALELGADAYLAAPVPPRRLRAHLLGLLRRAPMGVAASAASAAAEAALPTLAAGGWTLDRFDNRLSRGGRDVSLTELQGALMQVLVERFGHVVPRERLVDALARGRELHARSVDVYVARLRNRLRGERVDDLQIESVRGRGYRLSLTEGASRSPAPAAGLRWVAPAAPVAAALNGALVSG